jgi:hypothetical protein
MITPYENGTSVNVQGLICNIPPAGYVFNFFTKELEYRGVYQRSPKKEEQYWERIKEPDWYFQVMKDWENYDKHKKETDADFYDERLEEYKKQEWDRRLNGFWFANNGVPTYITGLHYLYMQWWSIDVGYPKFRMPDLEKSYFLDYCIEDDLCLGMVEVTKRRFGKSFFAGIFLMEYITRTKMTFAGIQSKTGGDAKKFFSKTIVNPFRRLPKFFRPEYDTSLGVNPRTEMRFQKTNVRGKKAEENVDKDELGSAIDHQSSDETAYDGQKIHRYVADECGKCFGKGTKILMFDGSVKNVEDIKNGEYVMGDDSTSRMVYGKTSGIETLYEIVPKKGESFVCNESHILTLSVSDKFNYKNKKYKTGDILNISVYDYLFNLKDTYKKCLALYRKGWELQKKEHLIDPYMLGVWLGDGNSRDFSITNIDNEVINSVYKFSNNHNLSITIKGKDKNLYHVTSNKAGENHITKELRRLNLLITKSKKTSGIKHIPDEYLIDSRENRLQLLAGLLDTDGYAVIRKGNLCCFEITQKRKELSYDIKKLATSLGYYCSINIKKASMKRSDGTYYICDVYRLIIYGDLDLIPTKIKRKTGNISTHKNRRNPLKTGFKVKEIGLGEYYGFAVNKNNLFLLSDGTVVHNTVEANVYDRHEVVRYCLKDDEGRIIGKALYTTTVEKLDTDNNGVQDAFKLLWDESDQEKRQENGETSSGLYRFFMSAKKTRNFNKYGFPDEEKTLQTILLERKAVKNNPRALSARIRKEPLTIEEAFSIDADDCIFNVINIAKREQELKENPIIKRKVLFYRDLDQKVKWRQAKSDEEFHWLITQLPEEKDQNKYTIEQKQKKPARTHDGAIAIDGYSNVQGGKFGSKASAWIGRRFNFLDSENTGKAIGWLYGRPQVKEVLYEQIMLAAEFYGYHAYFEHNFDDWFTYFRDRGKLNYLGSYPKSVIDPVKLATTERHKGFPTTPFSLTKQTDTGIMYFENYCHLIDFQELLTDAKKFDPNDRTKFDITVSFLMLIVLLMEPIVVKKKQEPIVKSYTPNLIF